MCCAVRLHRIYTWPKKVSLIKSTHVLPLLLGEIDAHKVTELVKFPHEVFLEVLIKEEMQVGMVSLLPGLVYVTPKRTKQRYGTRA